MTLAVLACALVCPSCETLQTSRNPNATAREKALAAIHDAENGLKFMIPPGVTTWLLLEADPVKRRQDAAWVYAAATAINTMATGAILTPEQLEAQIKLFTRDNARYAQLAAALLADYSSVYGAFKLAETSPAKFLVEIATLAENAARPYLSPVAPATASTFRRSEVTIVFERAMKPLGPARR